MQDLSVGYNGKPLIRDIVLGNRKGGDRFADGEWTGKSTILKSITRQLKLMGGKVIFNEKNLHQISNKELATQMAVVLTERSATYDLPRYCGFRPLSLHGKVRKSFLRG